MATLRPLLREVRRMDKNKKGDDREIQIIFEFVAIMLGLLVYLFAKG